jgi:cytoskeletal protein CcmA (bactofilin family)
LIDKKKRPLNASNSPKPTNVTLSLLASGCHYHGKMVVGGNARIGGNVEGTIISQGHLLIEEGATVEGEITGNTVILLGNVRGKVTASNVLQIGPRATMNGQVSAQSLLVEQGAEVVGEFMKWTGSEVQR